MGITVQSVQSERRSERIAVSLRKYTRLASPIHGKGHESPCGWADDRDMRRKVCKTACEMPCAFPLRFARDVQIQSVICLCVARATRIRRHCGDGCCLGASAAIKPQHIGHSHRPTGRKRPRKAGKTKPQARAGISFKTPAREKSLRYISLDRRQPVLSIKRFHAREPFIQHGRIRL